MYFDESCKNVNRANTEFSGKPFISPFLSNNGRNQISSLNLLEGGKVITSQTGVGATYLMNISCI